MSKNTPAAFDDVKEMQTFRLPVSVIDRLNRVKVSSRLNKTTIVTDALVAHLDKHYPESAA